MINFDYFNAKMVACTPSKSLPLLKKSNDDVDDDKRDKFGVKWNRSGGG